jgi:hypothetical protein
MSYGTTLYNVTRVTRWFIKPGVSPAGRQHRLRQHGTLLIFFTKNSLSEIFYEKDLASSALPEAKCSAESVTA